MDKEYTIGVYSIDNCKYCEQAKALLNNNNIKYIETKIKSTDERSQIKEMFPHAKSFPIIVIDHKWIGGFTQLTEWLRQKNENV